jgi:hypothetical protein
METPRRLYSSISISKFASANSLSSSSDQLFPLESLKWEAQTGDLLILGFANQDPNIMEFRIGHRQ